jgi:hypothetical protein
MVYAATGSLRTPHQLTEDFSMPQFEPRAVATRASFVPFTLLALLLLAACGANPQAPANPTEAPAAVASPVQVPSAYPAPDASADQGYPAPLGSAPETPVPTAASGASGPASQPTSAPPAGTAPALDSLPAGMNVGEVPPDLALVAVADLMQRAGVAADAVSVVSGEAVEWPDGAIGCARPGMMYPQVITPGYKLVLAVGERQYTYHAASEGPFFLCEN